MTIERSEYAPYDQMPAFDQGMRDWHTGTHGREHSDVAAQAYDRGMEYAMRVAREQFKPNSQE